MENETSITAGTEALNKALVIGSRIPKFRVWSVEGKSFISNTGNPNIFPYNGKLGMTCNGNGHGAVSTEEWIAEYYKIQQYTEMNDVNGREVYEGDIFKNVDTGEYCFVRYEDGKFMTYYGGVEYYGRVNERKFTLETTVGNLHEVVGNIFENIDLLNEEHFYGCL